MTRGADSPRVDAIAQRELPSRYSKLLEKVSGGHALFKPQSVVLPERGGRIGDGGYIEKGLFVWLFNVFDRPPDGIPALEWVEAEDVVTKPEHNSGVLKSSTTSSVQFRASIGSEASILPAGVPPMHIEPEVTLQESAFAFLAYAGDTREVKILKRPRRAKVKAWLMQHYEDLYTLYEGDVVIICETARSSGWVGGLAYRDSSEASGGIQIALPGVAEVGLGFRHSREHDMDLLSTKGPDPNAWSVDAPPVYTVVVGLVAARRQASFRLLKKRLISIFIPNKERPPTDHSRGERFGPSSQESQQSDTAPGTGASSAGDQLVELDIDAPLEVDVADDAERLCDDVGDDILLHRILDKALAENEDADLAVGDWNLITDFMHAYHDDGIELDPTNILCYVDLEPYPGGVQAVHVTRIGHSDDCLYAAEDWQRIQALRNAHNSESETWTWYDSARMEQKSNPSAALFGDAALPTFEGIHAFSDSASTAFSPAPSILGGDDEGAKSMINFKLGRGLGNFAALQAAAVASQQQIAELQSMVTQLQAERSQIFAATGAPAHPAFMQPAFHQDWRRRTEARTKLICAHNRAGNTLCAWHDSRRERRAYPPRMAPDGMLNCGCSEEEALFEESLARNGVGSYRPAGDQVRMDPGLRKPLLDLLKRRYGYKDGDFEIDVSSGTWRDEEDGLSWENRLRTSRRP